jgi:hypothetical protein
MNLLLAFALAFQDGVPEAAFKQIEEALQNAKTAKIAFSCEGEMKFGGQSNTFKASGTLLLKQENKVNLAMKLIRGGQEFEITLVSDGSKVWQKIGPSPPDGGRSQKESQELPRRSHGPSRNRNGGHVLDRRRPRNAGCVQGV